MVTYLLLLFTTAYQGNVDCFSEMQLTFCTKSYLHFMLLAKNKVSNIIPPFLYERVTSEVYAGCSNRVNCCISTSCLLIPPISLCTAFSRKKKIYPQPMTHHVSCKRLLIISSPPGCQRDAFSLSKSKLKTNSVFKSDGRFLCPSGSPGKGICFPVTPTIPSLEAGRFFSL